jgi:hypothetical protein
MDNPGDVRGQGRGRGCSFPLASWYLIGRAPRARDVQILCLAHISIIKNISSRRRCGSLVTKGGRSSLRWLQSRRIKRLLGRLTTRPFSIRSLQRLLAPTHRPKYYPNGSGTGSYGTVSRNLLRVCGESHLPSDFPVLTVHPR